MSKTPNEQMSKTKLWRGPSDRLYYNGSPVLYRITCITSDHLFKCKDLSYIICVIAENFGLSASGQRKFADISDLMLLLCCTVLPSLTWPQMIFQRVWFFFTSKKAQKLTDGHEGSAYAHIFICFITVHCKILYILYCVMSGLFSAASVVNHWKANWTKDFDS